MDRIREYIAKTTRHDGRRFPLRKRTSATKRDESSNNGAKTCVTARKNMHEIVTESSEGKNGLSHDERLQLLDEATIQFLIAEMLNKSRENEPKIEITDTCDVNGFEYFTDNYETLKEELDEVFNKNVLIEYLTNVSQELEQLDNQLDNRIGDWRLFKVGNVNKMFDAILEKTQNDSKMLSSYLKQLLETEPEAETNKADESSRQQRKSSIGKWMIGVGMFSLVVLLSVRVKYLR